MIEGAARAAPSSSPVLAVALALAGIRAALAAAFAVAAAALAPDSTAALVAFAMGAAALLIVAAVRYGRPRRSPAPRRELRFAHALAVTLLPSTAGVAALAAVSLAFEPILAAALAGVLAGLAVVALGAAVTSAARPHS